MLTLGYNMYRISSLAFSDFRFLRVGIKISFFLKVINLYDKSKIFQLRALGPWVQCFKNGGLGSFDG